MNHTNGRVLAAACLRGLSHSAFRLYYLLDVAARQRDAVDAYFQVTLKGLLEVHPGVAGRRAGSATVLKQLNELRRRNLIDLLSMPQRNKPGAPVLVKVLEPKIPPDDPGDVGMLIGLQ